MGINYTPHTFAVAELVTAATLNAEVATPFTALQAAWSAYTPAWTSTGTNPTIGNGTLTGRTLRIGKTYLWRIFLTFGSTTDPGTGTWQFTTPATPAVGLRAPAGQFTCFDTSASQVRHGLLDTSTGAIVLGMDLANVRLSATNPFTWTTGDSVGLQGVLEAA